MPNDPWDAAFGVSAKAEVDPWESVFGSKPRPRLSREIAGASVHQERHANPPLPIRPAAPAPALSRDLAGAMVHQERPRSGLSRALAANLEHPEPQPAPSAPTSAPTIGDRLATAGAAFGRGAINTVAGGLRGMALQAEDLTRRMPDPTQPIIDSATGELAQQQRRPVQESAAFKLGRALESGAERLPIDDRLESSFWNREVPEGLGAFAGFAAVTAATRGRGGVVPGMELAAAGGASQMYDEARAAGASEDDAMLAARLGQAPGAVQVLPIMRALQRVDQRTGGQASSRLVRALVSGVEGAIEEAVAEAVGQAGFNAIAREIFDEDRGLAEGVFEAARAGGTVGAIANVLLGALPGRAPSLPANQAEDPLRYRRPGVGLEGATAADVLANIRRRRPEQQQAAADVLAYADPTGYEQPDPRTPREETVRRHPYDGMPRPDAAIATEDAIEASRFVTEAAERTRVQELERIADLGERGVLSPDDAEAKLAQVETEYVARIQRAAAALPAVPEGHVRLWRAEKNQLPEGIDPARLQDPDDLIGRHFTSDPQYATDFLGNAGDPTQKHLRYVDVPGGVATASTGAAVRGGMAAADEYVIPREWASRAEPIGDMTGAMDRGQNAGHIAENRPENSPRSVPSEASSEGRPRARGRELDVVFPDKSRVKAEFAVMEADDVVPSNDPFSFERNAAYPQRIQGRAYHGERGRAARDVVEANTPKWDDELSLDPTITVGGGPSLVTTDGLAVAGNQRDMLLKRVIRQHPEKYQAYRAKLLERAAQFGLSPEEISGMRSPVLVRVITDPDVDVADVERLRELNALSDQEPGKVKDAISDAAARADRLQRAQGALTHFAETVQAEQTLRGYLGTSDGGAFVLKLLDDDVIGQHEKGRYLDAGGDVTPEGKQLIERMMYAAALGDADVIARAPAGVLHKIEHALPALVRGAQAPEWDIRATVRDALELLGEAKAAGLKVRDHHGQADAFGEGGGRFGNDVVEMAELLERTPQREITRRFRRYAEYANEQLRGETSLFGDAVQPTEALDELLGRTAAVRPMRFARRRSGLTPAELQRVGLSELEVAAAAGDPNRTRWDTPAIKAARRKSRAIDETIAIDTPERQELRGQIAAELYGAGAREKNRTVHLVFGPPAGGKSSAVVDPLAERTGALVLDADMAKERLPEFADGAGAAAVHEESSLIVDGIVFVRALEAGDDIIWPKVGRDEASARQLIETLQEEGYTVHLYMNELPVEKAVQRAIGRWKETGRFVDPDYIANRVGNLPSATFDALKAHPAVSTFHRYSNDVAKGEDPRLIERGGPGAPVDARPGGHGVQPRPEGAPRAQGAAGAEGPGDGDAGSGPGGVRPLITSPLEAGYRPFATEALPDVVQPRVGDATTAPKRSEIVADLSRSLRIPILEGRLGRGMRLAEAVYKVMPAVVRTKFLTDIEAVSHEVGHHLHKLLFGTTPKGDLGVRALAPWKAELDPLGAGISSGDRAEGLAEFVRRYLTNPAAAKKAAPQFYAYCEGRLQQEFPDVHGALERARENYARWLDASPAARQLSRISIQETPRHYSIRDRWTRFRAHYIDDLAPVERAIRDMTEGKGPKAVQEDAALLGRLMHGYAGQADHFLERGTLDFNTLQPKGRALKAILQPVAADLDDFRAYLVSRRDVELHGRVDEDGVPAPVETGGRLEDAEWTVEHLEKKHPAFKEAAEQLYGYQDELLQYIVDAGVVSPDSAAKMREMNRNYVPFFRMMEDEGGRSGLGKKLDHLFAPVKRIKGSGRDIIDPLESIVKNTFAYAQLAARQQVSRALGELASSSGDRGRWLERIDAPQRVTQTSMGELEGQLKKLLGDDALKGVDRDEVLAIFRPGDLFSERRVISILEGDERVWYRVNDPDLYDALLGVGREHLDVVTSLFAKPAALLRAGATLAPEFLVRNPARDQVMAFVQSEYGFKPGVDLVRGLFHVVSKSDLYWQWKAAGGERSSLVGMDRDYLQRQLRTLAGQKRGRVENVVKTPIELLQALSAAMEDATRIGEFGRAVGQLGTDKSALQTAAGAAREVSSDFQRHGLKLAGWRAMAAFWNARIQGYDKLFRSFRNDPVGATARSFVAITLPSILLHYVNTSDDELREEYYEIPQWQRDIFWCLKAGGIWWRIPKPFELGMVFGTIPERLLEWMDTQDPEGMKVALGDMLKSNTAGMLPIPTFAQPLIDNMANYNTFMNRAIVPRHLEGVDAEFQFTDNTSEVSRQLGRWLGYSPAKLDNLLTSYTGGLGRLGSEAVDLAARGARTAAGEQLPAKPDRGIHAVPGVRGFTMPEPAASSESVERFYRRYGAADRAERTVKLLEREGRFDELERFETRPDVDERLAEKAYLQKDAEFFSDLRKEMAEIRRDPTLSGAEKRKHLDELGRIMRENAADAIERASRTRP